MKDSLFLDICRNDYHAIFQMVREAIKLCPDELWDEQGDEPPFWQQAYHTLWWCDFYLSDSMETYRKPSLADDEANDLKYRTDKSPSRQQLQDYIGKVSRKCDEVLGRLTTEQLEGENAFHWTGPTLAHKLIYNIRHAQHHVGWMNSILSRKIGRSAEWVITAEG